MNLPSHARTELYGHSLIAIRFVTKREGVGVGAIVFDVNACPSGEEPGYSER